MQISEFQEMMKQLYFDKDSKRGVKATLSWLQDELAELKQALEESDKAAVELEFADVLAWLASLANITGVNLETAALMKYNGKCPKCNTSPCKCKFQVKKDVSAPSQ